MKFEVNSAIPESQRETAIFCMSLIYMQVGFTTGFSHEELVNSLQSKLHFGQKDKTNYMGKNVPCTYEHAVLVCRVAIKMPV